MLKDKILLSKNEDLIDLIEWFVNQATSRLANREALQEIIQNGKFYGQKLGRAKKLLVKGNEWSFQAGSPFFVDKGGRSFCSQGIH